MTDEALQKAAGGGTKVGGNHLNKLSFVHDSITSEVPSRHSPIYGKTSLVFILAWVEPHRFLYLGISQCRNT